MTEPSRKADDAVSIDYEFNVIWKRYACRQCRKATRRRSGGVARRARERSGGRTRGGARDSGCFSASVHVPPEYHVSVLVAGQKLSFPESDLCSHCFNHVSQIRSWSQGQQCSGSHAQIPEHTSPWNICSTRPTRLRVRVVGRACSPVVLCYTVDEGSECISNKITQGFIHLKITKLEIAVKKSRLLLTSFG